MPDQALDPNAARVLVAVVVAMMATIAVVAFVSGWVRAECLRSGNPPTECRKSAWVGGGHPIPREAEQSRYRELTKLTSEGVS